jgi:pyrroloquinoline quinone biosynthesis protein B
MRVRLLGTAAGGGFPQWNCNCANCHQVRQGRAGLLPRTQSCVALSADGQKWFLLNASPDIRLQIETFAPLLPSAGTTRGTGIDSVLITNADLDHTLGLFILREGYPLTIHATPAVRAALADGLALDAVLSCYCGVEWRTPLETPAPLLTTDGEPSGLSYQAIALPGKPPRYREKDAAPAPGDCIGYRFVDERTGGRLVFMPDVAALNVAAQEHLRSCDALLMDGTFWSDSEMQQTGAGSASAARMGHWPIGGPEGSLALLAQLPIGRKIYMHINNTNPILQPDSPEHKAVEAGGCEVGYDGLEFTL